VAGETDATTPLADATPAAPAAANALKLPWYSFLYRMLGAQGTFWLWIICVGAVWWTLKPALVRLSNRRPHTIAVRDVTPAATGGMTRWVSLTGVEVTVDGTLLRQPQAVLPPVPILLDPDSPAGRWWLETLAFAELIREGTADEAERNAATNAITQRMAKLEAGEAPGLPLPDRALVIQDKRLVEGGWISTQPPLEDDPSDQQEAMAFIADRQAYVELLHERVKPDVLVEGVLEWTPNVVQRRFDEELGFPVAPYLLQANREPRDWESVVCASSLILLIFLCAGLIGAARVRRVEDEALQSGEGLV